MKHAALIAALLLCAAPVHAGAHFDNAGAGLGSGGGEGLEKDLGSNIGPRVTNFGSWAVACWFKIDGTGSDQVLFESAREDATGNNFTVFYVQGATSLLYFQPVGATATSLVTVTTGVWHSAIAVRIASNDTRIYLDGVRGNDDATDSEMTVASRVIIGRHHDHTTKASALIGDVSHVAVWKGYAFTDADALAWHAGTHPFKIGVGKIWNYWPLRGDGPLVTRARSIAGVGDILVPVDGTQEKTDSYPIRQPRAQYSRSSPRRIFNAWAPDTAYRRDGYAIAA